LRKKHWFQIYIFVAAAVSLFECILVAFPDSYDLQIITLLVGVVLFVFGAATTCLYMPLAVSWPRRLHSSALPEVLLDAACLSIGLVFVFQNRGVATLRCCRVFRFGTDRVLYARCVMYRTYRLCAVTSVWYSQLYPAKQGSALYLLTRWSHLIVTYLSKIGEELFTSASKGSVVRHKNYVSFSEPTENFHQVVLGFFFFLAYILAVAFFYMAQQQPGGDLNPWVGVCDTLPHCFVIMLRLAFYDGKRIVQARIRLC
jgi:hypothetical protein